MQKHKTIIAIVTIMLFSVGFAQNKVEAEKLVSEGIEFHDKGDYPTAITMYDKALELDTDNFLALAEKSMSLNAANQFDESIATAKMTIKKHPKEDLKSLYVTYANSLDQSKKSKEALKVYDEAIKKYPDYYQLYFNKGISYVNNNNQEEALKNFQKSLLLNPYHAGSLNAIGIIEMEKNRIPSIMALSRFLIVEPQTSRAKKNVEYLRKMFSQGVTKTGENSISIALESDIIEKTSKDKKRPNDFSSTDLILSMSGLVDFDNENPNQTEVDKFIRKFRNICSSLDETKKNNFGFYWDFFVPYFLEMNSKNLIEPFAYIVFVDSTQQGVSDWHKKNQTKLDEFYEWSKNYKWKS